MLGLRRPQDIAGWLAARLGTWLIFLRARLRVRQCAPVPCVMARTEQSREHTAQDNGWPLELSQARAGDHSVRAWADHTMPCSFAFWAPPVAQHLVPQDGWMLVEHTKVPERCGCCCLGQDQSP